MTVFGLDNLLQVLVNGCSCFWEFLLLGHGPFSCMNGYDRSQSVILPRLRSLTRLLYWLGISSRSSFTQYSCIYTLTVKYLFVLWSPDTFEQRNDKGRETSEGFHIQKDLKQTKVSNPRNRVKERGFGCRDNWKYKILI